MLTLLKVIKQFVVTVSMEGPGSIVTKTLKIESQKSRLIMLISNIQVPLSIILPIKEYLPDLPKKGVVEAQLLQREPYPF